MHPIKNISLISPFQNILEKREYLETSLSDKEISKPDTNSSNKNDLKNNHNELVLIGNIKTSKKLENLKFIYKDMAELNPLNPYTLLRGVSIEYIESFNSELFSKILMETYLNESFPVDLFNKLNDSEQYLMQMYFESLYQRPIDIQKDSHMIGTPSKTKKKCDKSKYVYSKFKKAMIETFYLDYRIFLNENKNYDKDLFRDIKTAYNYFLFKEHFINQEDPLDFIMNVFMGIRQGRRSKKKTTEPSCWRINTNKKTPCRISSIYKYYVATSATAKSLFTEFLFNKHTSNKSVFWIMTIDNIKRKIKSRVMLFGKIYTKCQANKFKMREELTKLNAFKHNRNSLNKFIFLLPWLMSDAREAIEQCVEEFHDENIHLLEIQKNNLKKKFSLRLN